MNRRQKFSLGYFLVVLFIAMIIGEYFYKPWTEKQTEVQYSVFLEDLDKGAVATASLTSTRITYTLKPDSAKKSGVTDSVNTSADVASETEIDEEDDPEKLLIVDGIILDVNQPFRSRTRSGPKATTRAVMLGNGNSGVNSMTRSVVRVMDPFLVERLISADVAFSGVDQSEGFFDMILGFLLPLLPLVIIWYIIFRNMQGGGSVLSFGRSKAKELQGEMTGVHFKDLGGVGEAEVELREIIEFLKEPERFNKFGAKLPKGVLLVGPPGTGKTMLARATSGEAGVPFFFITGSSFVEMFVGVGAARVRDLFEQAKKKAPCIIFIDEIDAIGQARSARFNSNSEQESTLNQLLAEMDGFTPNTGVVIMAATNRPEILDQALLRPGRFDRQIQVVLPTEEGREEILKIHTRAMPLDSKVDLKAIAKVTPGFSGADLANIANEASLLAVRRKADAVAAKDFDLAIERVIAGLQRKTPLTPEVRKKVAYHETGHALVACFLPGTDPVHKVSIIPTAKGALGYTLQRPMEDQYLIGETELRSRMAVMLGGRAAELLIFKEPSTGASNDLERATETARRMVTEFGMSTKLGPVRYAAPSMMYLNNGGTSNRGDLGTETFAAIDAEIHELVSAAQDQARQILLDHEKALHETARVLQENEVITGEEIQAILERIEGKTEDKAENEAKESGLEAKAKTDGLDESEIENSTALGYEQATTQEN